MEHKNARVSTPVLVVIVVLGALLCVIVNSLSTIYVYHFHRNSLLDHPETQWKCEKLGVELVVSSEGKLSGTYNNGSDLIPLDVTNRIPSTNNHIECYAGDELLYLHCFYENIDNGVFYVTVSSAESTIDIDAVLDEVPYTFVKQAG